MKDSHRSDKHRKNLEVRKIRSKSKKRHRDFSVSVSCSDSDEARSGRKRKRGDSTKKRVRYSSSSEDEVARRRRKAKKSGQHERSSERKMSLKGKRLSPKRRRRTKIRGSRGSRSHISPIISYPTSYSSRGCSTCRDFSSSGESEFERSRRSVYDGGDNKVSTRDQSARGERTTKTLDKNKSKSRNRSKPWSCSSCSVCSSSSHSYSSKKRPRDGKKCVGSLRSVLSTKSSKEIQRSSQNVADVIHAYDDYAPSRSNDSYDQGRKRESEMLPHSYNKHALDKKRRIEEDGDWNTNVHSASFARSSKALQDMQENVDVKGKEAISSYKAMNTIGENDAQSWGNEVLPTICEFVTSNPQLGKKSEISTNVENSENEGLELLLRTKALENFRKFRNGLHEKERSLDGRAVGNDICTQSIAKDQTQKQELPKKAGGKVGTAEQTPKNTGIIGGLSEGSVQIGIYEHETRFKTNDSPPVSEKPLELENNNINVSKEGALMVRHNPSASHSTGTTREMHQKDSLRSRQVRDGSISNAALCWNKNQNIMKQVPNSEEPSRKKVYNLLSGTKNVSDKEATEMPQATAQSREVHYEGVCKVDESSVLSLRDPENGVCATDNSKVEAKDSSQFQQKTMSVMRGGEMVQVSYKVYIPQKSPALARRQLQRPSYALQ